ncbi:MAG: diguanylate cyclase, partial [Casimicrobium sp.]
MTPQHHSLGGNDGVVTNWRPGDPRHVFLQALTAAWIAAGLIAALLIELLQMPAGPLKIVIALSTPLTGLVVYMLIWRRHYESAAYVLCISVDVAFFVFYCLAHTMPLSESVGFTEARGTIIAMTGLGVIFAGAMLSRWAPVAFAAANVAILFLVIRPLFPQTELRIALPIYWWTIALSMWMFNTYLQRMITNLGAANSRRRLQMQQLSETTALLELASDAIIVRDAVGVINFWNKGAETIYGVAAANALGKHFDELVASDYQRPPREIEEHFFKHGRWDGELSQRTADGRTIWIASRWALRRDTPDGPAAILVINSEITERKSQQARLAFLSEHDLLTGLPNRALLVDRLGQAILRARRSGRALALMVIDVDRFKSINSGLGHPVGDSVLQNVARRLQASVGTDNTLAHLAGDTFGAIIENCGAAADLTAIAEQLAKTVADPMEIQGHHLVITLSIGIAVSSTGSESADELIRGADTAMYAAKDAGRNGYRLFEHTLDQRHLRRTRLENALRLAIDNNELALVYQPKVDIQSGHIHGVEVLLRWNSAEFGVIAPGDFIPLAEETGLINSIGLWVLRTACTQVRAWQLSGSDTLTVAVNLSAKQFQQKDLVEAIAGILATTDFSADHLELEITESAIMQDVE